MNKLISASVYRERILHELRIEQVKARARVNQLIDMGGEDPETGEDHDSASRYADGIHAAFMLVRRLSLRAAYKTKASEDPR